MLSNVSLSISSTWLSLPLPTSSEMALFTRVVRRAEALDRRPDRPGDVVLDAVVGPDVHRPPAGVVDGGLHLAPVVLGAAGERHRGAFGREHLHDPLGRCPGSRR